MGLGYTEQELEYAHLISRSQNNTKKTFDFYVNRAMFPFIDLRGNILGFGGRTLGDDKRKYINPMDSAFYDKNKFLFSLNIAKNEAVKTGKFILCEGNLDVVSLTQAGFENAIASCGTALTEGQVKLLNTYANEIVICYDADEAGRKATLKAIDIIRGCGFKASVLTVRGAKDPDEFIKKYGAAAFGNLLEKAETALDYRLRIESERFDMTSQRGKFDFKDAAVPILAGIDKKTEYEYYAKKVADSVEVSFTAIDEEVNAFKSGKRRKEQRREEQSVRNFSYLRETISPDISQHTGEFNAEEMIVTYLYLNPDKCNYLSQILPSNKFLTEFNRRVYEFLLDRISGGFDHSLSSMPESFSVDEIGRITAMIVRRQEEGLTDEVAHECIERLNSYKPKRDLGSLTEDEIRAFMNEQKKT
ncbi:MAG: toprim domain-containing protein, partial [Ruminococcus sp.]|nr:toprim domain-containing protein [Ruminococcus sp.]